MEILKSDILFIINVNSGSKESDAFAKELKLTQPEYTYFLSYSKKMFTHFMKHNADRFSVFVAVGGDGTVRSLLPYVIGNQKILAVIPHGSGNGFAREMGFNVELSKLMAALQRRMYTSIDLLEVNKYLCVNVAGVGLDSHVTHSFNKEKTRGLLTYIRVAIASYFKFKYIHAKVETGETVVEGLFLMVSIANTRQYGNNAFIAPNANPTDGKYELVLVRPMPFFVLLKYAYLLFKGKLKESKYIQFIQTSKETIIHSNLNKIHVDGDAKKSKGTMNIKLLPQAIRVIKV